MISLCLTHLNRFDMLIQSFEQVLNDDRISEIVISDDASDIDVYKAIVEYYKLYPKVKVYRNVSNVGVYKNKLTSVSLASNDWVIVGDSDNIFNAGYIDKLFEQMPWDSKTEYSPAHADPKFDYSSLCGQLITKENVNSFWRKPQFDAFLNTMNSFFNRAEYMGAWDSSIEPISSDSIYMNYRWLAAGNKIKVVEGMRYFHRIHNGSHYVNNCAASTVIHRQIEEKIKRLK